MGEKIYKCNFKHCKCEEILNKSNSVVINKKHYHRECAIIKNTINDIRQYYRERVDEAVNMALLNKVLANIVFDKNCDPEYLLFALRLANETGKPLKSPTYLHYLATDGRYRKLYEQAKSQYQKPEMNLDKEFDFTETETANQGGTIRKITSFSDILR